MDSGVLFQQMRRRQSAHEMFKEIMMAFLFGRDKLGGQLASLLLDVDRLKSDMQELKIHIQNNNHRSGLFPLLKYKESFSIKVFMESMSNIDFFRDYKNLIHGMDEQSIINVAKIISRIHLLNKQPQRYYDMFSPDELTEFKRKDCEYWSRIIKFSDNCFAYKDYYLPLNRFDAHIFYDKYGLDECCTIAAINSRDIIDAGADIGNSALLFTRYTKKRVFTFEPMTESYNYVKKTIEMNNLEKVIPVKMGLGDTCGTRTFYYRGPGSSFNPIPGEKNVPTETVNVTTLDEFIAGASEPIDVGLIKTDLEGSEQAFLVGAERTIKMFKPALLISIYHNASDFFHIKSILESWNLGYKFKIIKSDDSLVLRETLLFAEVVVH